MPQTDLTSKEFSAGQDALNRADWAEAAAAFERALAAAGTPESHALAEALGLAEAHDGLAVALWWLNEVDAAHRHRARAFVGYRERGEVGRAARIACWLAREQLFLDGNAPAMQGWFSRAEQLVRMLPPGGSERAWYDVMSASVTATPREMASTAAVAAAVARHTGDSELEAFALAFHGQALATLGRVGEGMALLDEAMTMATGGEAADLTIISEIFCVLLSTCETTGDLTRSDIWCRRAMAFAQQYSCPFLFAYCRTAYGGLLTALGRWAEAETALTDAISAFERGHRGLRTHAVIKLADLRVSQDKLEEAELLLIGLEDLRAAVVPLSRLHLRKGETALARAVLEQALIPDTPPALDQLPLLLALVDVLIELDDRPAVERVMATLNGMADMAGSDLFTARIAFVRGRIELHAGDFAAARADFDAALAHLKAYEQSLLAGQVRLRMAELLAGSDTAGAVAWARGALATFERIGATHEAAGAAALLRRLGAARGGPARPDAVLTHREEEIAALLARGLSNREIADRLVISPKTVEHHVGRILDKLNLRGRAEVAALAARGGLPTPPAP